MVKMIRLRYLESSPGIREYVGTSCRSIQQILDRFSCKAITLSSYETWNIFGKSTHFWRFLVKILKLHKIRFWASQQLLAIQNEHCRYLKLSPDFSDQSWLHFRGVGSNLNEISTQEIELFQSENFENFAIFANFGQNP